MFFGPRFRLFVQAIHERLELVTIHAPHTAAPDLYGRQFSRANERVHLGDAHTEIGGHVLIVLMTSALVVAIWGVARDRLIAIVSTALSSVCGSLGC